MSDEPSVSPFLGSDDALEALIARLMAEHARRSAVRERARAAERTLGVLARGQVSVVAVADDMQDVEVPMEFYDPEALAELIAARARRAAEEAAELERRDFRAQLGFESPSDLEQRIVARRLGLDPERLNLGVNEAIPPLLRIAIDGRPTSDTCECGRPTHYRAETGRWHHEDGTRECGFPGDTTRLEPWEPRDVLHPDEATAVPAAALETVERLRAAYLLPRAGESPTFDAQLLECLGGMK